jgi:hypothetical protein
MFGDKGIILESSISNTVKLMMALFSRDSGETVLLSLPILKKSTNGNFQTGKDRFKRWYNPRELVALRLLLERATLIADEYAEGTIELEKILKEDEDASALILTESDTKLTIQDAFTFDIPRHKWNP